LPISSSSNPTCAESRSGFKLAVGEYGSGKSQFLCRLRDIAWKNGYVVSRIELSPKECLYDNPLKVYQAVINNLIYHEPNPNIADTQGIEAFLENHFFHTMRMLGIEQMMTSIGLDVRVKMWLYRCRDARSLASDAGSVGPSRRR